MEGSGKVTDFLCRNCRSRLGEAVLRYENMPPLSQKLPTVPDKNGITLNVCECPECGLIQLANEPVSYYREVIRAVGVSPEMADFRRKQFRDYLQKYDLHGKKIFEVGCGAGEYLTLMRDAADPGTDIRGIEFGQETCRQARAAGFQVEQIYLENGNETVDDGKFDGFFILNYLEHLPNLPQVLQAISKNLRPGGCGLVEVPNFDWMLREQLFTEFTIDHLYYFTEKSLRRVLEMHGFDVLSCSCVRYDYILCAEVRKRQGSDFSSFTQVGDALTRELSDFCAPFTRDEVAVWGAGHQAFAVMAAAKLDKKICCVLDSAPFKQGRFSPATGLPIYPPQILANGTVKAVIIMAGSYSDEVADIIKARWGDCFKLALLRGNHLEILT